MKRFAVIAAALAIAGAAFAQASAPYSPSNVRITGGTITGVGVTSSTLDGTVIGGKVPADAHVKALTSDSVETQAIKAKTVSAADAKDGLTVNAPQIIGGHIDAAVIGASAQADATVKALKSDSLATQAIKAKTLSAADTNGLTVNDPQIIGGHIDAAVIGAANAADATVKAFKADSVTSTGALSAGDATVKGLKATSVTSSGALSAVDITAKSTTLNGGNLIARAAAGAATKPDTSGTFGSVQLFSMPSGHTNIVYFDPARTADNRIAYSQWVSGVHAVSSFTADAFAGTKCGICVYGGFKDGITGIATNSGSGALTHTGAMTVNGATTIKGSLFSNSFSTVAATVQGGGGGGKAAALVVASGGPAIGMSMITKGDADNGAWDAIAASPAGSGAANLSFRIVNDANTSDKPWLTVYRKGMTVNGIASNSGAGAWNHTGAFSSGVVSISNPGDDYSFRINSTTPYAGSILNAKGDADTGGWDMMTTASGTGRQGGLTFRAVNDAGKATTPWLTVFRKQMTIDGITSSSGNKPWVHNGDLVVTGLVSAKDYRVGGVGGALSSLKLTPVKFAALPACNADGLGLIYVVTDAGDNTQYGALIGSSGGKTVMALCNGSNWTAH